MDHGLDVKMPTKANKHNHRFVQLKDGEYVLSNVIENLYKAMEGLRKRKVNHKGLGIQSDNVLSG